MKFNSLYFLIPLIGYIGLWLMGSILFLLYFNLYRIPIDKDYTVIVKMLPSFISIITVAICSFLSFFITSKIFFKKYKSPLTQQNIIMIGIISLIFTISIDLLTTVIIERIDILEYPINMMYLLAWLVIIPAIFLSGRKKII